MGSMEGPVCCLPWLVNMEPESQVISRLQNHHDPTSSDMLRDDHLLSMHSQWVHRSPGTLLGPPKCFRTQTHPMP